MSEQQQNAVASGQFKMPELEAPPHQPALPLNFYVHVIESPAPNDLLMGRTEGRVLTDALVLAGTRGSYLLAVDTDTFAKALLSLASVNIAQVGAIPVIHLSCHGDEQGIQLTSGDTFRWTNLIEAFRRINRAMGGLLLLCMSSCGGFGAEQMARATGEHPFFALIGHHSAAGWEDCAVGFVTFYHLLGKGKTLQEAVAGMRVASGDDGFQLAFAQETQQRWQRMILDLLTRRIQQQQQSDGPV